MKSIENENENIIINMKKNADCVDNKADNIEINEKFSTAVKNETEEKEEFDVKIEVEKLSQNDVIFKTIEKNGTKRECDSQIDNKSKNKRKTLTLDIALIGLFTALISVGAFIQIPLPIIPFTMQVFFVLLGAQFLGAKRATAAAFLYMALGLVGVPIFTRGGGWSYIFQPSFGFIIGFIFASFATALVIKCIDKSPIRFVKKSREIFYFLAGLVGIVIIYAFGMVYFYFLKDLYFHAPIPFMSLFAILFLPTIFGDLISLAISSIIAGRLRKVIRL